MARPIQIDVKLVAKAQRTVKTTRDLDSFRSALAVLLPARVGLTLEATAHLLGVGTASINRMQTRFQTGRTAASPLRNWGGRRQSLLTVQEEVAFLQPWAAQARAPGTRHPKNDPRIMKAWKKNSPKRWQPCSDLAW